MTGEHCIYREESASIHLEIWQNGDIRSLWFDDVILQTEIHLHDAAVLPNPVNRAMLAHLMFDRPLARVLLAGCGGGAIARWFNRRDPGIAGDAVEVSATVARLAREYFDFPRPQSNWRLHVADIRDFLETSDRRYDFILVDLEEEQLTPKWVTGEDFLVQCRDHLSAQGVLTLNLICADVESCSGALINVRRVFDRGITLVSNPEHDNLLALASPDGMPEPIDDDTLRHLGRRWGLDFIGLERQMKRIAATATR